MERMSVEEKIAHLEKVVDELSGVIARQDGEIAQLTKRVSMLMQREAEREASDGTAAHFGDERPPHW